jgi:hypothetical protein
MLFGEPTPLVEVGAEPDETLPPEDAEVWEAPSGYLRCARHQVFSLMLIRKDKKFRIIPYGNIDEGEGVFNGVSFTFHFFVGRAKYAAVIEGMITHMQRVADKIAGGKAELVRANGDEIRSVTWNVVEVPVEATPGEDEGPAEDE